MKHWKRLSLLTVAVLAAALAARMMTPLPNSGQEVVFRSGNITVTRQDVEKTIQSYQSAQSIKPEIQVPTEEEALNIQVKAKLLEEKIWQYNITLTPEEEEDAYHDTEDAWQALKEDAAAGSEGAREVKEMMEQYIAAAGWSEEEYIQFTNEGVASLILRQKLVDQEYGGDYDRLEAELDAECARLLGENAS